MVRFLQKDFSSQHGSRHFDSIEADPFAQVHEKPPGAKNSDAFRKGPANNTSCQEIPIEHSSVLVILGCPEQHGQ